MQSLLIKIILLAITLCGFGYLFMYNSKILKKIEGLKIFSTGVLYNLIGKRVKELNKKIYRSASLNKKSKSYKVYMYFENMIVNLEMKEDNVTVGGFLTFITCISLFVALALSWVLNARYLIFLYFWAVFYLIVVLFRFAALLKYERREARIMDAEDLLASDITGGVYNAIVRYQDSFHPDIRRYFKNFIDDIENKGYSFKEAIIRLNDNLGPLFNSFAQKAITYEEKADKTLSDIFNPIIEINRCRRTLRFINTQAFNQLRLELILSCAIIMGYALFAMGMDSYFSYILLKATVGKFLIVADIVGVAWVLAYIASLKAKSL